MIIEINEAWLKKYKDQATEAGVDPGVVETIARNMCLIHLDTDFARRWGSQLACEIKNKEIFG